MENTIIDRERKVVLHSYYLESERPLPAVLILPGGAYRICSKAEGEPIAKAYNAAGFHAFVLEYSVGENAVWDTPYRDVCAAMQHILSAAKTHSVDPEKIAVIGFSAGGHLAAYSALSKKLPFAALLLGYACTLGETVGVFGNYPDTVSIIDKNSPPAFLFAASDDKAVSVENTLAFASAMHRSGVPFECHIYPVGGHGFALGEAENRTDGWLPESVKWLNEVFSGRFSKRLSFGSADDKNAYLGIENTLGHLLKNPKAKAVLEKYLPGRFTDESKLKMGGCFPLKRVLQGKADDGLLAAIDGELSGIENTDGGDD